MMAFGDVKVGSVMPWSNGHCSSSEFHIYGFVFYHGCSDGSVYPLKLNLLPICILLVALVCGVHYHVLVAEFGFGPCGANGKGAVFEVVKFVRSLLIDYFQIRKAGLMSWAPANYSFASIYQSVVEKLLERAIDSFHNVFIKSEFFARPIAGCPQLLHL